MVDDQEAPTGEAGETSEGETNEAEEAAQDLLPDKATSDDEEASGNQLVVVQDADAEEVHDESIEHPTKLLRIAHMVRSMLDEVRTTDLDEAGRDRLRAIHNQAVDSLGEIVSPELEEELEDIFPDLADGTPTGAELRIVQAQLAGWLEGLFRGIQASMATQQRAAQHQLQQMRKQAQQGGQGGEGETRSGQYL